MSESNTAPTDRDTLAAFYDGWEEYQRLLVTALTPLTPEQLQLTAANDLRTIEVIARHIIGARGRWMHRALEDVPAEIEAMRRWDTDDAPVRTADELVAALHTSWQALRAALDRWTPTDMAQLFTRNREGETTPFSRRWVIWHLIEHDIHHGGEISLTLGMHGLAAPDL
jgi:uncharacterized damage-inducible protein DinB